MLAFGNGDKQVCAMNLLRTVRGEVPFARVKGIDREHIDKPASLAVDLQADAEWVLETFEPRLSDEEVELIATEAADGEYEIRASISS